MYKQVKPQSFWTTLPGILTGIAGLISAIAALLGVLHAIGIIGSAPKESQVVQPGIAAPKQPVQELSPREKLMELAYAKRRSMTSPIDALKFPTSSDPVCQSVRTRLSMANQKSAGLEAIASNTDPKISLKDAALVEAEIDRQAQSMSKLFDGLIQEGKQAHCILVM